MVSLAARLGRRRDFADPGRGGLRLLQRAGPAGGPGSGTGRPGGNYRPGSGTGGAGSGRAYGGPGCAVRCPGFDRHPAVRIHSHSGTGYGRRYRYAGTHADPRGRFYRQG